MRAVSNNSRRAVASLGLLLIALATGCQEVTPARDAGDPPDGPSGPLDTGPNTELDAATPAARLLARFSGDLGYLRPDGTTLSVPVEGALRVALDDRFDLTIAGGVLRGRVLDDGGLQRLEILSAEGSLEILDATMPETGGELDETTGRLLVGGPTSVDDVLSLRISATLMEAGDSCRAAAMVPVYVTHDLGCTAAVTIDGVTLEPLTDHWATGGICSPASEFRWVGETMEGIPAYVDGRESSLPCQTLLLRDATDPTRTIEAERCQVATFVLPKAQTFSYTARWSNGDITTDEFVTPAMGCQPLVLCIATDGDCSASEEDVIENTLAPDPENNTVTELRFPFHWIERINRHRFDFESTEIGFSMSIFRQYPDESLDTTTYDVASPELTISLRTRADDGTWYSFSDLTAPGGSGTVSVDALDEATSEVTVTFANVRLYSSVGTDPDPSHWAQFSGTISGPFEQRTVPGG